MQPNRSGKLVEKILYRKDYDGESIVDMGRDLSECFDPRFNPIVEEIPPMESTPDFMSGTFTLSLTWVPDEQ